MNIIIVGGGPAGMMAAIAAKQHAPDIHVTLLEKNEKLGKKLYITGKGRCNLTNNTDIKGLLEHMNTNARFMHSAFYAMDAAQLMDFFETWLVPLKTERGNRVFPVSEKASDINKALEACLRTLDVRICLNTEVEHIAHEQNCFNIKTIHKMYQADAVVIATGGLSYAMTGSTGDGYAFAKSFGHHIVDTFPSLVSINVKEKWVSALEGLSLKNIGCKAVLTNGKTIYRDLGEMMFTFTGVTGPLILSASAFITDKINKTEPSIILSIDMKPGLTKEQLDARILRDFKTHSNKHFANVLELLLPKRMVDVLVSLTGIAADKKIHDITKAERLLLVDTLKNIKLTPISTGGYHEAVITKGGVNVKEINASTMMSRLVPGMFFAGEVIDVDAMTGGYNLQIAFSTGYLAGLSAADILA